MIENLDVILLLDGILQIQDHQVTGFQLRLNQVVGQIGDAHAFLKKLYDEGRVVDLDGRRENAVVLCGGILYRTAVKALLLRENQLLLGNVCEGQILFFQDGVVRIGDKGDAGSLDERSLEIRIHDALAHDNGDIQVVGTEHLQQGAGGMRLDFQFHVRELLIILYHGVRHKGPQDGFYNAHPELSGHHVHAVVQLADLCQDLHHLVGIGNEIFTGTGESDLLADAVKQGNAQFLLQRLNMESHRGLCVSELIRSLCEVLQFCHPQKCHQISVFHYFLLRLLHRNWKMSGSSEVKHMI